MTRLLVAYAEPRPEDPCSCLCVIWRFDGNKRGNSLSGLRHLSILLLSANCLSTYFIQPAKVRSAFTAKSKQTNSWHHKISRGVKAGSKNAAVIPGVDLCKDLNIFQNKDQMRTFYIQIKTNSYQKALFYFDLYHVSLRINQVVVYPIYFGLRQWS